ncbi:hypothetical protein DdX_12297 [Ditylenchus destructor]|uniref:C-type lectin domain-containing protein n=1 Tax=Ditylenchus destructor TaxID=166010 RepID=A0AAD4R3U7_9BILA|nr:hypothetical protein DdX_12297 [Ditylenchus destructor]
MLKLAVILLLFAMIIMEVEAVTQKCDTQKCPAGTQCVFTGLYHICMESEFASSDANCSRQQLPAPGCAVWVGLARLVAGTTNDNSLFFWLDSTNSTYRHWARGQPFGTSQHCVNLWSGARGDLVGFWDNNNCDTTVDIRKAVCAQCPSECLRTRLYWGLF